MSTPLCTRLACVALEAREVPATWTAATAADLIARVAQANNTAGDDTIVLSPGATYTLTAADNTEFGPTGLPVVAATLPDGETPSGSLTIVGNGATIERSPTAGTPQNPAYFRLVAVEAGAVLDISDLTLQGGFTQGTPTLPARGGAVYNLGTLTLTDVTVRNNIAYGFQAYRSTGGPAYGGGVWSDGDLTITRGAMQGNRAMGGRGSGAGAGRFDSPSGTSGGDGLGGGVYIAGGTADLSGVRLTGNTARGGDGGNGRDRYTGRESPDGGDGGDGRGGGVHAAGGTTTLTDCVFKGNDAAGGVGGQGGRGGARRGTDGATGVGEGGGIYVGAGVAAEWDDTQFRGNTASTRGKNFYRA